MALDTRRKRQSVASVAKFWHPPVVVPDGSFSVGDRAQIARTYRGLAEADEGGGGAADVAEYVLAIRRRRR